MDTQQSPPPKRPPEIETERSLPVETEREQPPPELPPPPPAGSENAWDLLYGILFSPQRTFEGIVRRQEPPVETALIVFTVVSLLGAWVTLFTAFPLVDSRYVAALRNLPGVVFGLSITLGFVAWFGWSAALQLIAEFLGGRGRGLVLFTLAGLSYLPRIFGAPGAVLANLAGLQLNNAVQLVLAGWVLYLNFLAVRATHRLSPARALLAVLLPAIILLGLVLLGAVLVVVAVLPFLDQFGDFPL